MKSRIVSLFVSTVSMVGFSGGVSWAASSTVNLPAVSIAAIAPATEADSRELLRRVEMANEGLYANLQSFVCEESIVRFRGKVNSDNLRHLDSVTAKVSFENGSEQYTDVRQNNIERGSLSNVSGAWSEGEYGTLLRQTQRLLRAEPVRFLKFTEQDGTPAALYAFDVSEADTPWTLVVGGRSYRLPFRTEVLVSRATGQILSVSRTSERVPGELYISEIRWSVALASTELNSATWLLPVSGEYSVTYSNSNRREVNRLRFGNYRRYGSEVALRFDAGN